MNKTIQNDASPSQPKTDMRPCPYAKRTPEDPIGDAGRTSLMIVPPENICRAADAYRRKYHPAAYERLPAHMSMLYPYAPQEAWPALLPRLTEVAQTMTPFEIRLVRWGGGMNETDGGFGWMVDDPEPFMAIRKCFMAITPKPFLPPRDFRPHLTLGWFPGGKHFEEAWQRVRKDSVDWSFSVDHIWLCFASSRGVWTLARRLDFGRSAAK